MPYIGKKPADIIATAVDTTTGTFSGAVSASSVDADGGVTIDNITIDGTEIDLSSGDLTIDVAGDITLDAGGGDVNFQEGGTLYGFMAKSSNDLLVGNAISDGDVLIRGNDGGSNISAVTFDMSNAGAATFNGDLFTNGNLLRTSTNNGNTLGGGTVSNNGGNITVYGGSHASLASNIRFRSGSTVTMLMDSTGAMTKPLQPAFQVKLASAQNNIPVDSTTTILFANEVFDQNDDFDASTYTFTAPVTGKYQFNVSILTSVLDSAAAYYQIQLHTSNRIYYNTLDPDFGQDNTYHNQDISVLADMDASDTAIVKIYQSGGTQQSDLDATSHFSGVLVC